MKKGVMIIVICFCSVAASAQSQEVQQLLLNVEKLSQFKKILKNMQDGYAILHQGYSTIKDLSEGNFSLHKTFLDGLLEVSPGVRKYWKVKRILELQIRLVSDSKTAFKEFKSNASFSLQEIEYFKTVYDRLFRESLESLEELVLVVTAGTLRMNDAERLALIDTLYAGVEDQASFLRAFNASTLALSLQRGSERADLNLSKKLRGF